MTLERRREQKPRGHSTPRERGPCEAGQQGDSQLPALCPSRGKGKPPAAASFQVPEVRGLGQTCFCLQPPWKDLSPDPPFNTQGALGGPSRVLTAPWVT